MKKILKRLNDLKFHSFIAGLVWVMLPGIVCSKTNVFTNSLGMEFIYIKPGSFLMGSPLDEPKRFMNEKQHKVTITRGFYIQATEVTQRQWKTVMGNNPSDFIDCGENCPVENVSFNEVQTFINRMNRLEAMNGVYRLPTEAEWEYACRAGANTPFAFGSCLSTNDANYDGNYPYDQCPKGIYREQPVPVASYDPNAWGLYDFHGNVWEWCQDWYEEYRSGEENDPTGPQSGIARVLRGGGWLNLAERCRSAARIYKDPSTRNWSYGFRLALKGHAKAIKEVAVSSHFLFSRENLIARSQSNTFYANDSEIVALVRLCDFAGYHRLRLEWINSQGQLYRSSGNHLIWTTGAQQEHDITVRYRLPIKGDAAADFLGEWRLDIYIDNQCFRSANFYIKNEKQSPFAPKRQRPKPQRTKTKLF